MDALEHAGWTEDRWRRHTEAEEATQRAVDRALPPLPYHPFALGFGVYGVTEAAFWVASVEGRAAATPFVFGAIVWALGALWDRARDRAFDRRMASWRAGLRGTPGV